MHYNKNAGRDSSEAKGEIRSSDTYLAIGHLFIWEMNFALVIAISLFSFAYFASSEEEGGTDVPCLLERCFVLGFLRFMSFVSYRGISESPHGRITAD